MFYDRAVLFNFHTDGEDKLSIHNRFNTNSLIECLKIVYLTPKSVTFVNGRNVKAKLMMKSLVYSQTESYKPKGMDEKSITFGFLKNWDDNKQGLMLYFRRRLIVPYHKTAQQKKNANGAIGIIDLDKNRVKNTVVVF